MKISVPPHKGLTEQEALAAFQKRKKQRTERATVAQLMIDLQSGNAQKVNVASQKTLLLLLGELS